METKDLRISLASELADTCKKRPHSFGMQPFTIAEREGFEPPEPFSSTVFKTAVIDHSTTSPIFSKDFRGHAAENGVQR